MRERARASGRRRRGSAHGARPPSLSSPQLYFSVPFSSLVVFFAIYIGLVNNVNQSPFVRFAAAQAVLLDILLILPGLIESVVRPPTAGPLFQAYVTLSNTAFLFVLACFLAGVGASLAGKSVRLPLVADAADAQVGRRF